jgi:hypothetical protein
MPTDLQSLLLMSLGSFLALVGSYFVPLLVNKAMEQLTWLPEAAKLVLSTALVAFFVALVAAISQLAQVQPWLDKSVLSVILALVSALLSFAGIGVGLAEGQVLRAQWLEARATIRRLTVP